MAPQRERARATQILDILENTHPDATCALHYRNAFELTVATILSARCTDERVNMVTPTLFARYPTPRALAEAKPADVESIIKSTGFFRAKAKSIMGCARALAGEHGGEVPRSIAPMVKLPGVGRKTANVVIGHAYGVNEGIAVDTHVLRVAGRLGLTHQEGDAAKRAAKPKKGEAPALNDDPIQVEAQLMKLVPQDRWTRTTDLLIFHGRRICIARRPLCGSCPVFTLCRWPLRQAHATLPAPRAKAAAAEGRARG